MATTPSALAYRRLKTNWRTRREEMKKLRAQGWTFTEIGREYKISRQRVERIINGDKT